MPVLRLIPAQGAPVVITKDTAIVGREPGCDVYANDGSVSRRHARLECRRGAWFVVDQQSANGTFLDSQRVSDALLRPGQEVRFGAVAFRVEIQEVGVGEGTVLGVGPGAPPPWPATPAGPAAPPAPYPPPPWPAPPAPPYAAPPGRPPGAPSPPPPAYGPPGAPGAPRGGAPPSAPGAPHPRVPPPPASPVRRGPPPARPPTRPAAAQGARSSGPQPREGKGPLFWIALGCGGMLLLAAVFVVLVIGGAVGLPFLMTRAPVAAVESHLREIKSGNLAEAQAHLAEGYRAQVSREALEGFVARHPAFKDHAASSWRSRSVQHNTADIAGTLTTTTGAKEEASFHLVQEAGAWRVAGVEVAGDRLEGRPKRPVASTVLKVETGEVHKRREGSAIKVAIKINVGGFQVRPEADRFIIDLAEDVETLGPTGERIEALSRQDVQRFTGSTSFEEGAVAALTTPLILDRRSVAGVYRVRLTVRDLVGGGQAIHEVTFELP